MAARFRGPGNREVRGDAYGERPVSATPLMLACAGGRFHQVQMLLDQGVDIDERAKDGSFALLKAIEKEQVEIARLLVQRGAKLSLPLKLSSAIKLEASDAVELALEQGMDIFGICDAPNALSEVLLRAIGERFLMHSAGEALYEAMVVAHAARRSVSTVDYVLGGTAAAEAIAVGAQAEALAVACVEMLDRESIHKVLASSKGNAALRRSIAANSKLFIDSSRVHYCLQSRWLGDYMQRVFYPPPDERAPLMRTYQFSKLILVLACNVLLVPVVAIYPPLETHHLPHHRSRLARYYLLDEPIVKLAISTADNVILAWLLTFGLGSRGEVYVLTYWTFMATVLRIVEASTELQSWLSDPFNTFESVSIALVFIALTFTIYTGIDVGTAFNVLLVSIPLLWMAVGLRVLALTPTVGRLVVVIGRMFYDVVSWFAIYLVFLAAFGASFTRSVHAPAGIDSFDDSIDLGDVYFLHGGPNQDDTALRVVGSILGEKVKNVKEFTNTTNQTVESEVFDSIAGYVDNVAASCQDLYVDLLIGGPTQTFSNAVSLLFQSSIQTADTVGYSSCLAYLATSRTNAVGVYIFLSFIFLSTVVLVNMLIAQMAQTFDSVWENGRADQRHARARLLVALEARQSALPATLCFGYLVSLVATRLTQLLAHWRTVRARVVEVPMQRLDQGPGGGEGVTAPVRLEETPPLDSSIPPRQGSAHLNSRARRLRAASVSKSMAGISPSILETQSLELEAGLAQLASIVAANSSFEPPPYLAASKNQLRTASTRLQRASTVDTDAGATDVSLDAGSGDGGDGKLAVLSTKVSGIEQTLAEVYTAVQQLLELERSRDRSLLPRSHHGMI